MSGILKNKMVPVCLLLFWLLVSACPQEKAANAEPVIDSIPVRKITLLFAGDLMQHREQINAARTSSGYDYTGCFAHVKEMISSADIAIGNLEVTLGGKPYRGYPMFSAPDEFLFALKDAGFDVLLTANNHCLDRGKKGLERTITMLDSLNIPYAGTYTDSTSRAGNYPLLLEKNGFKISILNYTYGTNGLETSPPHIVNYIDKGIIEKDIEAAKLQQPDAIIACMHWGDEYKSLPGKNEKELAGWLIGKGVTHVIGSHPHVVQPLEVRKDTLTGRKHVVAYSLGNFISNMSVRRTDGGVIVNLELTKDSVATLSACDYSLVWTARPSPPRRKNHTMIPLSHPADSLSANEQRRMETFIGDSRALFKKYNVGIEERKMGREEEKEEEEGLPDN